MKKCMKCGENLSDEIAFCTNCGYRVDVFNNNIKKTKTSPLSVIGLIIGAMISVFSYTIIINLNGGAFELQKLLLDYSNPNSRIGVVIGFLFGYTIYTFVPSIVGMILSILGLLKKKELLPILGIIINALNFIISICVSVFIILSL